MRLEFDSSVSRMDQLLRVSDAKRPGRKHQHRPGIRANERVKRAKRRHAEGVQRKAKHYRDQVRAYWRGERDIHPDFSQRTL